MLFMFLSANASDLGDQIAYAGGFVGFIIAFIIFNLLQQQTLGIKENADLKETLSDVIKRLLDEDQDDYWTRIKSLHLYLDEDQESPPIS